VEQDRRKVCPEQSQARSIPLPALRAVRRSKALSQQQLAKRAGISSTTVRLVETNQRGAYPSTMRKLAAALKVPPVDLVHERLRK
jgi:transcriptional regulator with XRE-family HTH domain